MAQRLLWPTIEVIVLALWIGAAVFFSAAVAPVLFRVLPTRALAGEAVAGMLPVVFYSGVVAGLILLLTELSREDGRLWSGQPVAAAVMILSCAIAQWFVGPRIARVRDAIAGPVDELPVSDPRRIAFGRLHGLSVGWLGVAILAALVALVLAARALQPRR
jgi:uncharacterized protein DUF4149